VAFADATAIFLMRRVRDKPTLALTLPTGGTPLGLYERLRREYANANFSLNFTTVFMLDEYADLLSYPSGSFLEHLQQHLGGLVFNQSTTFHAITPSIRDDVTSYDGLIDASGGLDLAVIGVGRNGHVGFNEPGSRVDARTHLVQLSRSTLEANFPGTPEAARPRSAITMGLADLRQARSVLMLVAGEGKRDVAAALANERFDPSVPATYLLEHPDLTVVMDCDLLI
jgi:glucosamine-6-phosphate deaminase